VAGGTKKKALCLKFPLKREKNPSVSEKDTCRKRKLKKKASSNRKVYTGKNVTPRLWRRSAACYLGERKQIGTSREKKDSRLPHEKREEEKKEGRGEKRGRKKLLQSQNAGRRPRKFI